MKKLSLFIAIMAMLICLFAITVCAASTNEFGTVETSDKIDLTGMATDTDVRVVLYDGAEYHTYPSQYIVTDATELTFDFSRINAAFGKNYSVTADKTSNDSIVRIEVPRHVLFIPGGPFNYGDSNNLVEVFFPSDSKLYKMNWGCFEQNIGLEKINFPKSMTEYHGTNHFAGCSSLKYVTFDEGYSVSYIPANFFSNCDSLETVVFPNCVTHINNGAFGGSDKIKTIVFGANLQTMNGPHSDCATSGSTWYLPASFYSSSVTSEPPSNMFHWAGTQTNGVSGNNNNPKNITFVYTGTKAEAEALQARFKAADAATGENCVGLKRLWDATLCTEAEYIELTGKQIGEGGATGYYLIYGYSACDAFYNGVHTMENINSCVGKCSVCGKVDTLKNPSHSLSYELNLGYVSNGTVTENCGNANCGYTNEITVEQIFTFVGYSTKDEGTALCVGYTVNNKAIEIYKNYDANLTLQFGMVASIIDDGEGLDLLAVNGGDVVANANYKSVVAPISLDYAGFDFVLKGFKAEHADLNVAMCAYAFDGKEISYITETSETVPSTVTITEIIQKENITMQ